MKRIPFLTTKIIFSSIFGILINSSSIAQCTSLANSSPLISGTTTIGNHFSAGFSNEVWSSCNNLYFNYRGNVTTTYFWNLGGGTTTGNSILTLQNSGNVGLSTTTPNFNFQVHGTKDYIVDKLATHSTDGGGGFAGSLNYGKTARIGLTNTTTGLTDKDGGVIRMSDNTLNIENLEAKEIILNSNGSILTLSGDHKKIYVGNYINYAVGTSALNSLGLLNVQGTENGLYIKTNIAGKYGLSVQMYDNSDNAINVFSNASPTIANFRVKGDGTVYARKYVTTLAAFPDYVFDESYSLLTFTELRSYLKNNHRLPKMPSALEVEKEGADLGELNRLLVEKVEELTLYILQLEERTKALETSK